ncbi:kinase-like protein [Penicillium capsulatum]|nr:kinase-like protein [Penicillium capsulatum]
MQFPLRICDLSFLGIYWLLFISLISAFPAATFPDQFDHALPSERGDLTTEHNIARRAAIELEEWKIYQKYRERAEDFPQPPFPTKLVQGTTKATRRTDPNDRRHELYTFGDQTVTVTDIMLGKGADGVVYKGTRREKSVAVKVSSDPHLLQAGAYMQSLKDSPNIMKQLELFRGESIGPNEKGVREENYFQVLPLIDGNLSGWLEQTSDDDWQEYHKTIAQQALQGLVDMHKKGIAHRDYKPGNIFFRMDGGKPEVFVADLDRATDQSTSSEVRTGTKGYTPLEYMIGPSYDTRKGDTSGAAMAMLQLLFARRVPKKKIPSLGYPVTLWKAILDAQSTKSKWPKYRKETSAARIKRKVLKSDKFEYLLPGMNEEEELADVFSRALCLQDERLTVEQFMNQLLPLLPLNPCS